MSVEHQEVSEEANVYLCSQWAKDTWNLSMIGIVLGIPLSDLPGSISRVPLALSALVALGSSIDILVRDYQMKQLD